jgi:bacillithiol system protein YtxJ
MTTFQLATAESNDVTERVIDLLSRYVVHLVYKHSPTCSLSQAAILEVYSYREEAGALPVTMIEVFRDRAMSDGIEYVTGVRHESPQVLLVRGGVVQWHASHRRVTAAAIADAVRRLAVDIS